MKTLSTLLFLLCSLAQAQQFSVLHYTETTGYNHNTKTKSRQMFESWETNLSYNVVTDDDGSEFDSLSNLMQYAVVIFSNTSGNSGLDANQRANFESYLQNGGSYLGIHAASDTYRHGTANGNKTGTWNYYAEEAAGASVQESPNHTNQNHNNTMTHSQVGHPILTGIPMPWNKTEEYYYWENGYLDTTFTELLRVGPTGTKSYDAPRMMAQCKNLAGGGKAFYTALGHSGNNFSNDVNFQQLIYNAMDWILPDPYSIESVAIQVRGALMCWEASEPATITLEIYLPEIQDWRYSVRYHQQSGCHELRGCDPVIVRLSAVSEEDGSEITSEPHEVEPKPFSRLEYGVFKPDCSIGQSFSVIDSSGREMMHGLVSSEGINMQGLSPGFYSVIVGENTYSIIR